MKKNEPISSIMTKEVVTLCLEDTLYSAEKRMKTHHIRHMPVVENEKVLGVVRLVDIFENLAEHVETEWYPKNNSQKT